MTLPPSPLPISVYQMGEGADLSKQVSDILLLSDSLASLLDIDNMAHKLNKKSQCKCKLCRNGQHLSYCYGAAWPYAGKCNVFFYITSQLFS